MFGGIYGNEPVEFFGGHGTIDVTVPSYFCMIIAVTGLMSLPLTVAQYRERKILKRFMATPINPSGILISQVIVNFIMTVLGMVVLIVVGKIVFDLHFLGGIADYILISTYNFEYVFFRTFNSRSFTQRQNSNCNLLSYLFSDAVFVRCYHAY